MTAPQLELFAPTRMLADCQPGDTIRLPGWRDAMTIHDITVTGTHIQVHGMWHPPGQKPPRYNDVAAGAGGFSRDDEPVHIITPR